MSDSKFKIGDVVNHKSNKDLKMVIIDNGRFGAGSPTKDLGDKNLIPFYAVIITQI